MKPCTGTSDGMACSCGADVSTADKSSYHYTGKFLIERQVEALESIANSLRGKDVEVSSREPLQHLLQSIRDSRKVKVQPK